MGIYERYCKVFRDCLLIKEIELLDAAFEETQGWDSFAHMELIVNLEMEFSIKMSPNEIMRFHSFKDGLEILKERGILLSVQNRD